MHKKQCALDAARKKQLKLKEKLTQDIICYGIWQTKEDITKGVAMEKSKTVKLNLALKIQLSFRKHVLDQKSYNITLSCFYFQKMGSNIQ